jgi:hypothetical protein
MLVSQKHRNKAKISQLKFQKNEKRFGVLLFKSFLQYFRIVYYNNEFHHLETLQGLRMRQENRLSSHEQQEKWREVCE